MPRSTGPPIRGRWPATTAIARRHVHSLRARGWKHWTARPPCRAVFFSHPIPPPSRLPPPEGKMAGQRPDGGFPPSPAERAPLFLFVRMPRSNALPDLGVNVTFAFRPFVAVYTACSAPQKQTHIPALISVRKYEGSILAFRTHALPRAQAYASHRHSRLHLVYLLCAGVWMCRACWLEAGHCRSFRRNRIGWPSARWGCASSPH